MGVLDGKVIVITGASRGIGEATAVGFAAEGALLVLAARTVPDLERVAALCRDAGAANVSIVPTDITDEAQVKALVAQTIETSGRVDVFVANAGTSYANFTDKRYRELHTYDLDIVETLFKVNVFGTWLCLREALPVMSEGGSMIVVGSETGRALYPGAGMYALTKTTLDGMVTLAAKEMAERSIRVNCVSPGGMVDTQLFGPNKMPEFLKKNYPPLPDDVMTAAAVWLASDDSKDITGAFVSGKEFNSMPLEEIRASLAR